MALTSIFDQEVKEKHTFFMEAEGEKVTRWEVTGRGSCEADRGGEGEWWAYGSRERSLKFLLLAPLRHFKGSWAAGKLA